MKLNKRAMKAIVGTVIVTSNIMYSGINANATIVDNNVKEEYSIIKNIGYVYNPEVQIDLKVRSAPSVNGKIEGYLYNFDNIEIIGTTIDASGTVWDKILFNNKTAYVSDAYIMHYESPSDSIVDSAVSITKQFEVANSNQIAGNFDGQGLSLGYLQWCIGQGTLQPLLNRMDREYNSEMRKNFGTNYESIHKMLLDTLDNQLEWAKNINNFNNNISEPWYTQFVNLSKNQHFIDIESDAEAFKIRQAMIICEKYNLKTVRGFALAFDIVTQNGSISENAEQIINAGIKKNPNMTEKDLLQVIANAVADSSPSNSMDIRSRKMAIVNGKGFVHGILHNLDENYGLSDNTWR